MCSSKRQIRKKQNSILPTGTPWILQSSQTLVLESFISSVVILTMTQRPFREAHTLKYRTRGSSRLPLRVIHIPLNQEKPGFRIEIYYSDWIFQVAPRGSQSCCSLDRNHKTPSKHHVKNLPIPMPYALFYVYSKTGWWGNPATALLQSK
jgi:hypothetical protein